jgi:endonuclease G
MVRRVGLIGLLLALALGAARAADGPLYAGDPRVIDKELQPFVHVVDNPGFRIGYSEQHKDPLWVAFRAGKAHGRKFTRQRWKFEPDPRTEAHVVTEDYLHSHYQRGHLAPNFLIGKLYGSAAQHDTFLMSNITPQRPRLNELVWQRLEEAEADIVAPASGQLWVITGPVFDGKLHRLKAGIAIPDAFYRVWLRRDAGGQPQALAFIVPQSVRGTEPLSQFLVTVAQVEARTALELFPDLSRQRDEQVERQKEPAAWRVPTYDRKPGRYADKFDLSECPAGSPG